MRKLLVSGVGVVTLAGWAFAGSPAHASGPTLNAGSLFYVGAGGAVHNWECRAIVTGGLAVRTVIDACDYIITNTSTGVSTTYAANGQNVSTPNDAVSVGNYAVDFTSPWSNRDCWKAHADLPDGSTLTTSGCT